MSYPYAYNNPVPNQSQNPNGCYTVYPCHGYPQQHESYYPPPYRQGSAHSTPLLQRTANTGGPMYPSYQSPSQNSSGSGWTPSFPPQGAPGAYWSPAGSSPYSYYQQYPMYPGGYCPPPPPSGGGGGEDQEPPPPGVEAESVQPRPDAVTTPVVKDTVEDDAQREAVATPPLPPVDDSDQQHVPTPPPTTQLDETPPPSPEGTPPLPDTVDMAVDTPPPPDSPENSKDEMPNHFQQEEPPPSPPQAPPPPPPAPGHEELPTSMK